MTAVTLPAGSATPDTETPILGGRRAWLIWGTAVAAYMLAVFHRSSLGVAGIMAADRFHINSAELATFTMVQLAVYAFMQVPVGALLDRFGSKALLITGTITMTIAQCGFALTGTFAGGLVARVFLGLGDAMTFVSVIRLIALWFPPMRTPMVTQATGFIGQIGALAAAVPLSAALHHLGWRTTFLGAASLGILSGILLVLFVKDSPYPDERRTELKLRAVARAVKLAWSETGTRLGLWSHFTLQFSATVFALMWGFPYLTVAEGLSAGTASLLLSLMVLASIASSPVFGTFTARYPYSRSTLVLVTVAMIVGIWTVVLLLPGRAPLWLLIVLVMITAIGGPGSMVGFDFARTFNPPTHLGSATGIVNVGGFTASLGTVLIIGLVLDHVSPGGPSTYDVTGFRIAFATQYLVWAIGAFMILRLRRKIRRELRESEELHHLIPQKVRDKRDG